MLIPFQPWCALPSRCCTQAGLFRPSPEARTLCGRYAASWRGYRAPEKAPPRYIAEQTGGAFFDEDCAEHPADYTFHAFIPDGSEGFTAEETALLRENGTPQPGGIVVPLSRLSGELFNKALKFKIYDFLDWQTERPVMLRKWQEFAKRAWDGVNVFNCVLLQNPMCETMMRFEMPKEQSFEFIRDICSAIAPLEPVVISLKAATRRRS